MNSSERKTNTDNEIETTEIIPETLSEEDLIDDGNSIQKIDEPIQIDASYKGNVEIRYQNRKNGRIEVKKYHNAGTLKLCNAIATALSGRSSADLIPRNIMAKYNGANVLSQKISFSRTPTLLKYDDTQDKYIPISTVSDHDAQMVEFTFLIPVGFVTSLSINSLHIYNVLDEECASVTLNPAINIDSGSNLLISWRMHISCAFS